MPLTFDNLSKSTFSAKQIIQTFYFKGFQIWPVVKTGYSCFVKSLPFNEWDSMTIIVCYIGIYCVRFDLRDSMTAWKSVKSDLIISLIWQWMDQCFPCPAIFSGWRWRKCKLRGWNHEGWSTAFYETYVYCYFLEKD